MLYKVMVFVHIIFIYSVSSKSFLVVSMVLFHGLFVQVGGWSQVYKGLTYVTVRGAGHEVPLTQPRLALLLFRQFLKNEPMPALQSSRTFLDSASTLGYQQITECSYSFCPNHHLYFSCNTVKLLSAYASVHVCAVYDNSKGAVRQFD